MGGNWHVLSEKNMKLDQYIYIISKQDEATQKVAHGKLQGVPQY